MTELGRDQYAITRVHGRLPFDRAVTLSEQSIGELYIRADGRSDLEEFVRSAARSTSRRSNSSAELDARRGAG